MEKLIEIKIQTWVDFYANKIKEYSVKYLNIFTIMSKAHGLTSNKKYELKSNIIP